MDLSGFYPDAGEPDYAFHDDGGEHGAGGKGRELGGFLFAAGEKLFDGFFEDLHEGDDHDLTDPKSGRTVYLRHWSKLTIEKTKMPIGSRRRRPTWSGSVSNGSVPRVLSRSLTGNLLFRPVNRH